MDISGQVVFDLGSSGETDDVTFLCLMIQRHNQSQARYLQNILEMLRYLHSRSWTVSPMLAAFPLSILATFR